MQRVSSRTIIILPLILIGLIGSMIFSRPGRTHEPITTKIMFNREIIRIFQAHCLGCHSSGRLKADLPLTTYDEARPWAKAIKEEILEKRMSPYQPVKGYGQFRNDYLLSPREIESIVSWVEGGAPRGEEKDYPGPAIAELIGGEAWPLGRPDLILQSDGETRPAARESDEIRGFILPTRLKEQRWLSGFDFRPGDGAVVHSASFFIDRSSPAGKKKGAARLEVLGEWVPGQIADRLPPETARPLPAHA
ncbi:MAG TPA: cytochrome c, partial [Blastocatellia bacterium]|nr:cytochrome c [Blastocatellia bacterium]